MDTEEYLIEQATYEHNCELYELMCELEQYFDKLADAEYFTDSPSPVPNTEMKFLTQIQKFIKDHYKPPHKRDRP